MIDLRYNLSLLAYKIKSKLNRKKSDIDEDLDYASDYREDFTSDDDSFLKRDTEGNLEDGIVSVPDDEDEGSQAKMLRRKHILLAAGSVLFIGASCMAYSAMNPATSNANNEKAKGLARNMAQSQSTDLPAKYSDISKYQKNAGKEPNNKSVNSPAPSNHSQGNAASAPRANASTNRSYTSRPAVTTSSAPRATVSSSSRSATAKPQLSEAEKEAIRAEKEAKKAETEAINSSIAFKIAQAVTQSVAEPNTTQISGTTVQDFPYASTFAAGEAEGGMYALQAGTVIPATLQTGITSDSPNGDCIAIVRQDVYDSLTGTHLLIPQGSKIIGKYGEGGARGNERIGVVFTRIILPDGNSVTLPNQNAIDGTGMPGLSEKYTNHSGSLFKAAFMTALLGSAAQSATGNTSGDDSRSPGQEAVSGAVAQVMETASRILDREGNVSPTVTISPGHAFNIFINQDLSPSEYYE